jgi:hypothetical protein
LLISNIIGSYHLSIVIPSIILISIGTFPLIFPMLVVYADDSSGQSQADQSSSSQDRPLISSGAKQCMGRAMVGALGGGMVAGGPGGALLAGGIAGGMCVIQNR